MSIGFASDFLCFGGKKVFKNCKYFFFKYLFPSLWHSKCGRRDIRTKKSAKIEQFSSKHFEKKLLTKFYSFVVNAFAILLLGKNVSCRLEKNRCKKLERKKARTFSTFFSFYFSMAVLFSFDDGHLFTFWISFVTKKEKATTV